MSTIYLVGCSRDFVTSVEEALGEGTYELARRETIGFDPELVAEIVRKPGDLVTVGPALDEADALKFIAELTETVPHVPTVMVARPTADLWPQVVRAGARDIVPDAATSVVLKEALERSIETGRKLREAAGPAAVATAEGAPVATAGRVVAIVSPKGGSGKTTVASNLAATIARERPGDVVLADLDVQFGDIAHAYRLDPEYSLLNAVSPGVNPTTLKGFLTPHDSKVLTLAAPDRPEDADDIAADASAGVLRSLAELFAVTIVDTGAGLDDHTLAALEVATDVVFVTATDVPSVRAVVKEYDILSRLGLLDGRDAHLVLNRADARVGLSVSDIEQTIGLESSLELPSTRSIPSALNLGEPLVTQDARGPVGRGFTTFAQKLNLVDGAAGSTSSRPWRKK